MQAKPKQIFRIQPFKNASVGPDSDYVKKLWESIKSAINHIFKKNAAMLSFEELYRGAYNLVIQREGDLLYNGLTEVLNAHLRELSDNVGSNTEDTFLPDLVAKWSDYQTSCQMIRDILMYMDRTHVPKSEKMPVYDMGLHLFKTTVARRFQTRLVVALMLQVSKERGGEMIDRHLLKSATLMLVSLGRDVYTEYFEVPFLANSKEFFKLESQTLVHSCSCSEYLKKAESRLNEEHQRVQHCLDLSTEPRIREVVEHEMISSHLSALLEMSNSGIISMLRDDRVEDLRRMYRLFKRVPDGLDGMRTKLRGYVQECGLELVQRDEKDPAVFVRSLLELKGKYDQLISNAFQDDKVFIHAVNEAFEHFVNQNNRSPEYISLFIDQNMRDKKGCEEDDIDVLFDKVLMLFRYIQEKDIFEKYYKQHLAKRLLSGRCASDDSERSLISKLKAECGHQFTSKLEGMLNDMRTSAESNEAFRRSNTSNRTIEMSVHVLTTGFWPTQAVPVCQLPPEIMQCCDEYKNYYLRKHNGRKITWQLNLGSADVRCFGLDSGKKHELNVSTYVMITLLQFNQHPTLGYADLAARTAIPTGDLKRALQTLACAKYRILSKEPKSKEINPDDVFTFNAGFQCQLLKIKIGTVAATKETQQETSETRKRVDEDRKHVMDATLVRIMKSRKTCDHNNLVSEAIAQLQSRFAPNPAHIKVRIESLIEREYLERSANDRRVYQYVA